MEVRKPKYVVKPPMSLESKFLKEKAAKEAAEGKGKVSMNAWHVALRAWNGAGAPLCMTLALPGVLLPLACKDLEPSYLVVAIAHPYLCFSVASRMRQVLVVPMVPQRVGTGPSPRRQVPGFADLSSLVLSST